MLGAWVAGLNAGLASDTWPLMQGRFVPEANWSKGALWAAKPGQVVGPFHSLGGWYFGRVERVTPAADSLYNDQVKGQIMPARRARRRVGSPICSLRSIG